MEQIFINVTSLNFYIVFSKSTLSTFSKLLLPILPWSQLSCFPFLCLASTIWFLTVLNGTVQWDRSPTLQEFILLKFPMSSSGHSKLSSHDHNQFWNLSLASKYICLKHLFPLLLPTVFWVWEVSHLFCSLMICQLNKLIKLDPHRFEKVAQCLEHWLSSEDLASIPRIAISNSRSRGSNTLISPLWAPFIQLGNKFMKTKHLYIWNK